MLAAVGDLVEDVVVLLSAPPSRGTDVTAEVSRHRGGSAANVAVHAARLDGSARFVGQVGADPLGDRLLDELRGEGVEAVVFRGGRTGSIVVLVEPGGERTMLTDRGSAPDLTTAPTGALDGVDVLHVPAYSLLGGALAGVAAGLLRAARDRAVTTSVDASSIGALEAHGVEAFLAALADLAPDVLLANADEAALLGLGDAPPPGVDLVVVKRGGAPTRVLTAAEATEVPVVTRAVVDSTGAGDAFAAGLLTAIAGGGAVVDAVRAGHAAAAQVLGAPGGAPRWNGSEA